MNGGGTVTMPPWASKTSLDGLRHVGPHLIEPRPAERTAVTGAGHGYLAVLGLLPDARDDRGRPVLVTHFFEPGVLSAAQNVLLAVLDALHAAHAQGVGLVHDRLG